MTTLADAGLTVADVDLGDIDAESDHNLGDYFVETAWATQAVSGKRTHVLGRKGSGKSALFAQLPELVPAGTLVELITPDQYAWNVLRTYEEQLLAKEQAYKNAWQYSLAVAVIQAIAESQESFSDEARWTFLPAAKFLKDNYSSVSPGLTAAAASIIGRVKSLNLSAFGFGAGFSLADKADGQITLAIVTALMEAARPIIEERGFMLALDRLDDAWDGSGDAKAMVAGLLMAAKELNNAYGPRRDRPKGLKILPFIRSDIYDVVLFDDKDKHRPLELSIQWTPNLLEEMLDRRLPAGVTAAGLLDPDDMRGSIKPFSYILKRTFLRPREVLQFVGECIEQAGTSATVVTKDNIRAAEERYSSWKVEDLKQEYVKSDPNLPILLECFRQEASRYGSIEEAEQLVATKAPELIEGGMTPRTAIEKLFNYSILGIRVASQGSPRYKSEEPNLTLPTRGQIYVHQSLHKGLLITEARRRA